MLALTPWRGSGLQKPVHAMWMTIEEGEITIDSGSPLPTFTKMQGYVGGLVEHLYLPPLSTGAIAIGICNEEGLLLGLPRNFYLPSHQQWIVGKVMIVGFNPDSGNYTHLSEDDVKCITIIHEQLEVS
jgi:hypothetical protein